MAEKPEITVKYESSRTAVSVDCGYVCQYGLIISSGAGLSVLQLWPVKSDPSIGEQHNETGQKQVCIGSMSA